MVPLSFSVGSVASSSTLPESSAIEICGPSLVPVMVAVTIAVSLPPLPSMIVYSIWTVVVSPSARSSNAEPGS